MVGDIDDPKGMQTPVVVVDIDDRIEYPNLNAPNQHHENQTNKAVSSAAVPLPVPVPPPVPPSVPPYQHNKKDKKRG